MDFDDDILPLARRMDASLARVRTELLPLLASLDEDTLVAEYSAEEQARVSLAAAFVLAMATYAHDRLRRTTGRAAVDAQVQLKMDRILEYIQKLREITQRERNSGHSRQEKSGGDAEDKKTAAGGRKRAREEEGDDGAHTSAKQTAADDVYGDTILFAGAGPSSGRTKTSSFVQNLLRHVKTVE